MTDLAGTRTIVEIRRPRPFKPPTLALGLFGGLALGVVARLWMRLISKEPEFTWGGTLSIIIGFGVFGLTQSIVAIARRHEKRRKLLTAARVLGGVGLLPLFVGAGGLMFPTVLGGGLALARVGWSRVTRWICVGIAALPVLFVGNDLLGKFGLLSHSLLGFVMMLAVYGTIIWATRFTFAAQTDRARLARWVKITLSIALGLLFLVPLIGRGFA